MIHKFKNFFHIIIIFILVNIALQSSFLSNFIWATHEPFADLKMPINWLECHFLGFNLITTEALNCETGKNISQFNYGYIFLATPYNETLDLFYRDYLPYILIFLFIFLSTKIINPKNNFEITLLYLALLNPSSMLLMERMQLDCIIYISVILIVYNRFYIVNWFLSIYLTLIKIYPIIMLINIFVEKKNRSLKKIFLIFLFLTIITFIYLFINKEAYSFMINNMLPGKAGYHYLFSLNALPKIFKYIFNIKYQILLIIFYISFIIITTKFYKTIYKNNHYFKRELFTNNSKLFLVGGFLSLFLFISVSSYVYKEIFLILLIPFILEIKNKYGDKFFKTILFIIIFRYIFLFLYAYVNVNDGITYDDNQRVFSNIFLIFITLKSLFDFILMSIIASILYLKSKFYVMDKLQIK